MSYDEHVLLGPSSSSNLHFQLAAKRILCLRASSFSFFQEAESVRLRLSVYSEKSPAATVWHSKEENAFPSFRTCRVRRGCVGRAH